MPAEPYVTVTLRKDIVKKLNNVDPDKPTSAAVTDAIQDYITAKSARPTLKTPDTALYISGTSTAATVK